MVSSPSNALPNKEAWNSDICRCPRLLTVRLSNRASCLRSRSLSARKSESFSRMKPVSGLSATNCSSWPAVSTVSSSMGISPSTSNHPLFECSDMFQSPGCAIFRFSLPPSGHSMKKWSGCWRTKSISCNSPSAFRLTGVRPTNSSSASISERLLSSINVRSSSMLARSPLILRVT